MRAVGVEESAAVGAEHLDGFLRSDRPWPMVCAAVLERVHGGVGMEILRNALPDQQQRVDDAAGQQDVEQRARHIDPEVADGAGLRALDAADERDGDDDAHGRRPEVVRGQAGHLGQVAHRAFGV